MVGCSESRRIKELAGDKKREGKKKKKMSMVQQSKGMDACPRMHRKAVVRHARALWKKRQIAEANGVMQRDR